VSPGEKSAAAATAERVRAVLEAAEQSAAELRAEAAQEIEGQLARAQTVAERLSHRADEIERSLQAVADTVRQELSSLKADLEELRAVKEGIGGAATAEPAAEPPAAPPAGEPPAAPPPAKEPAAPEPRPAAPAGAGVEGARVIALNMALNGSPREDTARYLAENFQLDDPDALLDEVYARVSG
jgi:ABC-type transporter Mla subunit MlaD